MSKKSQKTRRRRREALIAPYRELLTTFRAPSLARVIEAAAVSPTAAHRALSLGRLFADAVRLWPDGGRDASAADLPYLVTATANRSPEFVSLEDYVPLDPRLDVRVDWGSRAYRILPGNLERPVAMFERARMVDRATRDALLRTRGFAISDLAELILTRLDEAASLLAEAWPRDSARPLPHDAPAVSDAEVERAQLLLTIATFTARWDRKSNIARALEWATREIGEFTFEPHDANSMFGTVLAVRRPELVVPVPVGYWTDVFEASLVQLAHEAASTDPATSARFRIESHRLFARMFAMSRLQLAGPFSLDGAAPSVFALMVDERTVVLLDVIVMLDAFDPASHAAISQHVSALRRLGVGGVLTGPSGEFHLHENTHVVRTLIVSAAGHVVIPGHPPVATASLDDLKWIVTRTRETPEDVFYFFDELANGDPATTLIAFETINTFEHWSSNGKSIARQGQRWDVISIEPHRGDAEWEQAAEWAPIEAALRTMGFPPLRTWDGYERHKQWPSCSFGMVPRGPVWELRFEKPFVAVQCSTDTPQTERDIVVNLAQSIHWKIDRSPELKAVLMPFADPAGIRITLHPLDDSGWPAIRLVNAIAPDIALGFSSDLLQLVAADGVRVEHELAEAVAQGLREAWPSAADFDAAAFIGAYDAAPPGIRSEESELPVRGPHLLADPIEVQRAAISVAERELARTLKERGVTPGRYEGEEATRLESERIAPVLREMLRLAMGPYDRKQLRECALRQIERCLCSKWSQARQRRQNERFPALAYDPLELEITQEQESHALTRLATLVAEESLVAPETGGTEGVNRLAWVQLLGDAHLLMRSYLRSESNHYGIVPAITSIDSMYDVKQENTAADASLFDQAAFVEARARSRMSDNSSPAAGVDQSSMQALYAHISEALSGAYGYHLETILTVLDVGRYWALSEGEEIADVSVEQLVDRCIEAAPDIPKDEVRAAAEQLILRPADLNQFIEHWELERRQVRMMTRPFVQSRSDHVYVLPWQCEGSRRVFLGYLSQGRLIWANGDATLELRRALDGLREARNKGLEVATEEMFSRITPYVKRNIKKPAVIGLDETAWEGEIDCVAVEDAKNTIWVADAKDPFAVFSPTTMSRSIYRFNGPDQYVDKLLKKVAVVSGHANTVAEFFRVPNPARTWTVRPLMVTRFVEPAAFARGLRVPLCSVSDLEAYIRQS